MKQVKGDGNARQQHAEQLNTARQFLQRLSKAEIPEIKPIAGYQIQINSFNKPQFFYCMVGVEGTANWTPKFTPVKSVARVFVSQYLAESFAECFIRQGMDVSIIQVVRP